MLHTVCSINSQTPDQPCAAIDVKIKNSIGRPCEFLEIFFRQIILLGTVSSVILDEIQKFNEIN